MRALVLSSGGNRGALQAGAAHELLRAGLAFDLIVGSSVGAINGAFLAAVPGAAQAERLVQLWRQLQGHQVLRGSRLALTARVLRRASSLYSDAALRRLLAEQLPYRLLEEAKVPLIVVAGDIRAGTPRQLRHGPVVEAVLASAAIPGIYPPVRWPDGTQLVDGGVVAGVPVTAAVDAGADEVWVLDAAQPCTGARPPRTALDVAGQALLVMEHAQDRLAIAAAAQRVARLRHLVLVCATDRWFSDFSAGAQLIEEGRRAARLFLRTQPMTR